MGRLLFLGLGWQMILVWYLCLIAELYQVYGVASEVSVDPKGYIIYCPCMGRFGNQAEHLLGTLAFAKGIDRTLVLPPWPTMMGFIEFDYWFRLEVIQDYHRVITSGKFMDEVAPLIWPPERRIGYCYKSQWSNLPNECEMKKGSPFGPFWNHLKVDFADTSFYNLSYDPYDFKLWKTHYPPKDFLVLAFKGAPAPFPVSQRNVELQKYLWWDESMVKPSIDLLYSHIKNNKYIAVHLRNGVDWERACESAVGLTSFMSSPQCLGYNNKRIITMDLCYPSKSTIISYIGKAVTEVGTNYVVVITDKYPLVSEIEANLSHLKVRAFHFDPDLPQYDIIIATRAELFIGNCMSSFTAFICRERDLIHNKPSTYFGLDELK